MHSSAPTQLRILPMTAFDSAPFVTSSNVVIKKFSVPKRELFCVDRRSNLEKDSSKTWNSSDSNSVRASLLHFNENIFDVTSCKKSCLIQRRHLWSHQVKGGGATCGEIKNWTLECSQLNVIFLVCVCLSVVWLSVCVAGCMPHVCQIVELILSVRLSIG